MVRSLQASQDGIKVAKGSFTSLGITQDEFALRVNVSRSTVSNFFRCKPVDRILFVQICDILKQDWQAIAGTLEPQNQPTEDIDARGQSVRKEVRSLIHEQYDVKGCFRGRSETITELKQWITEDQVRLLVLYGQGGIGKTSLAAKLADDLKDQFERVIWRSLQTAPKLELLLEDILSVLSHSKESSATVEQQISKLIQYLSQQRYLIVLDNAESIL